MSEITLNVPEYLYERIRQMAQSTDRPIETLMLDGLSSLFGEIPTTNFDQLDNDQLWAVVHHPFNLEQDMRLRELTMRSKVDDLTEDEEAEIDDLVDALDQYVLQRSKALAILKSRGVDIEKYLAGA
ncbi:MAG: hypothetical protein SFZ02_13875 [bacterium]|nr:hypothetical protein [bacterium]